ncbi:MAG: class I SAM-dependent methyltransferase [Firmicutes bacterium]|nr:class I SAM-dependent methyltransferase [Bacillota bacterium]
MANLEKAIHRDFKGWDFSYLEVSRRMHEYPLSWNYTIELHPYLKKADSLLDMGTGGGEYLSFLSSLHSLPKNSFATESYEPNVLIAKERLEPLGIEVRQISDDDKLPFDDNMFDLIINRHESYSCKEVYRVLKTGGIFLTQQVGGMNDYEINELLHADNPVDREWSLAKAVHELQQVGMKILKQKEDYTKTRFYDIGAIVYYLKAIPWQVPDFTVENYHERLKYINEIIMRVGFIEFTCHRFLIISQK